MCVFTTVSGTKKTSLNYNAGALYEHTQDLLEMVSCVLDYWWCIEQQKQKLKLRDASV